MQKEYLAICREGYEGIVLSGDRSQSRTEEVAAASQDTRRLLSEARADPRLMSGTMTNSRTVTPESSTGYPSTSRIELVG
jgi:hypothetical protein